MLLFIVAIVISYIYGTVSPQETDDAFHIALVLPENISPDGAVAVAGSINRNDHILPNNTLVLHSSIWNAFEMRSYNITALVGLFKISDVQVHYPLAVTSRLNVPLLLSGSPDPTIFGVYPDLIHLIQPTTDVTRLAFQLIQSHGWKEINVVTDELDHQMIDTVHRFSSGIAVSFHLVTTGTNVRVIVNKLLLYSCVSVLAMSSSSILDLLCEASLREHVSLFIVLYLQVEDLRSALSNVKGCNISKALEGTVLIHQELMPENKSTVLVSGMTYEQLVHDVYNSTLDSPINPYFNILHDAIWATALTLNATINSTLNFTADALRATLTRLSFSGASGHVDFSYPLNERRQSKVVIYKLVNGTKLHLQNPLDLNQTDLEVICFDLVALTPTQFTLSLLSTIFCFFLVTITFVLYCCYRKERIIKSTSFSLSMLMFIGCYLFLVYLLFLDLNYWPGYRGVIHSFIYQEIQCLTLIWISGLGVPSTLIFATLLVKISRVYHIFSSLKKMKLLSNMALFFYVMLLMIPNVVILIGWSVDMATYVDHGLASCSFDFPNLFLWLALLTVYFMILMLLLVTVAILTRKIRYKNFKDTKKVNTLVFLLIYTYAISITYWTVFTSIGDEQSARVVLKVSHTLIIVECIGFLFLPKIYPLVKKTLQRAQKSD